jgi:hypothetical protein
VAELRGGAVTSLANGKKRMTMPWPAYTATIPAFWAAMKGVPGWTYEATGENFEVTHRWLRANGTRTVKPDDFARMDVATVLHFVRWIDRGEKFCDGHWQGFYKQGLFHAAARALLAADWPPPEPTPPSSPVDELGRQGELF